MPYETRWIEGDAVFPRKEILPRSDWGYAILLNANRQPIITEETGAGPSVMVGVRAVKTDFGGWGHMRDVTTGRAVDPPFSPLPDEGGSVESIQLVPMGDTQIRVTLFPWMRSR